MGNSKSLLGYTIQQFKNIVETPEVSIDKIINNTVMKLVKKQVNKLTYSYNKDTKKIIPNYDIYDIRLEDELQYKKYYFPSDIINNEYYEDNKDQFALELFRFVEHSIPSYSVSNTLFYMYNIKKVDFLSTFSKEFYENNKDFFKQTEYCSIYIRIDADNNRFILSLPKTKENDIMLEFEKFYLNINNDIDQFNNIKNTLLTSRDIISPVPSDTSYDVLFYYVNYYDSNNLNQFDIDKTFAFFTFFNFIVKLCDSTFMYSNLTMYITDKTTNKPDAHRNKLFLQKIHDDNGKIERINIYHYEPHGSKYGFSFNTVKINEIYNKLTYIVNETIANKDKTSQFVNKITFNTQQASCLFGPQSLSAGLDIGYCTVFSTFWYNCLLNVIDTINLFDKKNESNYIKMKLHKKLSDIPIEKWIHKIDKAITDIKSNFVINYPPNNYDLEYILKNKKYMLEEDYKYIQNIFYKSKNINNLQDYIDNLDKFISGKNITKLTFNDFFNEYIEFLKDVIMYHDKDKIIEKLKEDFYKMRKLDYYNIFVSYALRIYDLANTSVFVSDIEKEQIRNAFTKYYKTISTKQHGKIVKFPKTIQTDKDYLDYIKKIIKMEKETKKYEEEKKRGLSEEQTTLFKKQKLERNIIEEYGEEEYNKMMKEQDEEIPKDIIKKKCSKDTECHFSINGTTNMNLSCENEICVPNKERIGTLCNSDSECLSEYCDNTRKIRFCRKK